ncbi:MAG: glycosyltransferase family 4 protein [Candidatus Sumerlaeia bacterium]|nr:glycosyltransferase family 4 protein [Candidatus Sumerlaeia bacterium]
MKIVFDARTVRPRRTGVGYAVERLLRALMECDRQNEYVVLMTDDAEWPRFSAPQNFRLLSGCPDYESHPRGDLWERFALPRLLECERADVFHGPAFRVPHTRCTCPTVVTVYDLTCMRCGSDYPWRFRCYMAWQGRRSCKAARAIIAPSAATARDLRDMLGVPESKIRVIPAAADSRFRPADPPDRARLAKIHPALSQPYILTVGTIEPRKRIDLLVAAFERARAAGSLSHSLVLAGKAGWKSGPSLRAVRDSAAAAAIHHLDYVDKADLVALYQGADLFVCASRYEGFGLPPLEAMACGCPVVTTSGGALAEVVGEAGIVVDGPCAELLAEAMVAVLTDGARRCEMSHRAVERASQFSWIASAQQTLNVYREIAGAK